MACVFKMFCTSSVVFTLVLQCGSIITAQIPCEIFTDSSIKCSNSNTLDFNSDTTVINLSDIPLSTTTFQKLMELTNIKTMHLRNSSIGRTIYNTTFENFTQLSTLDISSNNVELIEDNSFKSNTALQYLNCSFNKIKKLEFVANLENLEWLDASNNLIERFSSMIFDRLTNIKVINLSHNKITYILPLLFSKLRNLQQSDLSHNELDNFSIDFLKYNTNLCLLDLRHNILENVYAKDITCINSTNILIDEEQLNEASKEDLQKSNCMNKDVHVTCKNVNRITSPVLTIVTGHRHQEQTRCSVMLVAWVVFGLAVAAPLVHISLVLYRWIHTFTNLRRKGIKRKIFYKLKIWYIQNIHGLHG